MGAGKRDAAFYSDNFCLLCACAAWPQSPGGIATVRDRAARVRDWDGFANLAVRHRVQALAASALRQAGVQISEPARGKLWAAAERVAVDNLASAAELGRIQAALRDEGIAVVTLKGVPMAKLIYGDIGRRHAKDIDLLVEPRNFRAAGSLLERLGYVRSLPPPDASPALVGLWMRTWHDFSYKKGRQEIELHWRVAANCQLYEFDWQSPQADVQIAPAIVARTPDVRDLFAYLCAHGAANGWFRLKWLADIAALVALQPPGGIFALYDHARASGVGRPAGQALLLCWRLFGSEIPEALRASLSDDAILRLLVWIAMRRLRDAEHQDPATKRFGTLLSGPARLLLREGFSYKLREILLSLFDAHDALLVPYPEKMLILYPFARPFIWLWRQLGGKRRRL